MSNIKISDLGQAGTLTGVELVPIVQGNETVRTTLNQVKSFASIAISNNIIADAASTTIAPSVNAIKTYADGLVVGLLNDRGNYTPSITSPGAYPSSGGSGTGGAIQKGDIWFINGNGYLGTTAVVIGASVRALVNNPSPTTDSNWDILDASFIQATLQTVLNAGNTANGTITLTDGSETSVLSKNSLLFSSASSNTNYNNYSFQITNNGGDYINGSTDRLKVYDVTTNDSTELKYDSLKYNNSAFVGSLETATLTSSQTWTLPNATGTLALANNVWNATGNAGTVAGTNFIGTTDAIDLVAKTNNTERLRVLSTGQVTLSSLTGTGTRMVVANAVGQLSTQTITSPTLQTVTTAGNTTTVPIYTEGGFIAQNAVDSSGGAITCGIGNGGILSLTSVVGNGVEIKVDLTTGNRTLQVPDQDGTIALISDINTSNSWKTIGNAGTTPGTDFIGTTDNKDLVFKVNNTERLRIDSTFGDIYTDTSFRAIGVDTSIQAFNGSVGIMIANDYFLKPYIYINNGTGTAQIQSTNLTSPRIIELPDASGTIALTTTVTLQNVLAGTNKNLTNGRNLQGTNAGAGGLSGSNINAFGNSAAYANLGSNVNALGSNSAFTNSGSNVNALGSNAGNSNTGGDINAFGVSAASSNSGSGVNAIGNLAAGINTGNHVNALGQSSAGGNSGDYLNAFGFGAANGNSGNDVNAFGNGAAESNAGNEVNAFGSGAGLGNQISGATIFSNNTLPSYANYAAAAAAITVVLGASANCTYLYHDQATNSIGAVRL